MNDGGQTNPTPPSALPPSRGSASMVRTRPNGRDPAMRLGEGWIAGATIKLWDECASSSSEEI